MDLFGTLFTIGAFFLGSVPFGVIFSRMFGVQDPRGAGSGNIGFTNVVRLSGKKVGVLTLLGDFGKGYFVGWLALRIWGLEPLALLAGFAVVTGHIFSPFLGFRGGKGVATGLGSVLGLMPLIGALLIASWLFALGVWRYSSGSAIITFLIFPGMAAVIVGKIDVVLFSSLVSLLILYRHKENFVRIMDGTEGRVKFK